MFLFLKLVLSHLIADFILQFEELYQLKVRSFSGQLLHVLVHGAVIALLLFPYLNEPLILVYIVVLLAVHLAQDLIKYNLTKKHPRKTFLYYILDQLFHFLVLGAIFFLPVANEVRGFSNFPTLNLLYTNNALTLFFIFFITLTFAGNYTLNSFYRSYVKNTKPLHWITSGEMAWTIIERCVIASAVLFLQGPLWVLASLCIGLLRLPFPGLRDRNDFLVSAAYTLILSYLFMLVL